MKFTISSLFKKKVKAPEPKANLVFAFNYGGHDYYQWVDPLMFPMERAGTSILYSVELAQGMTNETYESLIDKAIVHIMKGATDPLRLSNAIGYLHDIKLRKSQIRPVILYYNQFAVNYVRDDEDPERQNPDIHRQKVEAFANAALERDSFFFALPEYKELTKRLGISTENWNDVINLSLQAERRNQASENLLK